LSISPVHEHLVEELVDKDYHKLVEELHEHLVHEIHEIGGALVRPKDMTVYSNRP
jgi:hypothetical protein